MKSLLQVRVNNVEDYVMKEAEALLDNIEAMANESEFVSVELDRDELVYSVLIQVDFPARHLISRGSSRDLESALEDSYIKMLTLLDSLSARGLNVPTGEGSGIGVPVGFLTSR